MLSLMYTDITVISTGSQLKKVFKMKSYADNLFVGDIIYVDNDEYRIIDIRYHYANV